LNWLLHHDNVPAHLSLETTEFVTPYLPDLASCDFTLFPKLKMKLKKLLLKVSDIQMDLQAVLNTIKENDFHGAFPAWKK
jgi:hypothetical protein